MNQSPRTTARIAGAFYLLVFLSGTASMLLSKSVPRLGYVADLLSSVFYIVVTALFYVLFEAVNRTVALVAAFFSLVGCAVSAVNCIFILAPLAAEHARERAFGVAIVFFGFYCLTIGYLVFKSTFLPRVLGVAMMIAGLGWLTFLWPPLASALAPYNMAPGILGEASLTFWLLIAGVNAERWKEQAAS